MNPDKENFKNTQWPWKANALSPSEVDLGSRLDLVRFEEVRLGTFRDWPLNFMNPEDLASNGFYYLGRGDEVRCAFCKVEIMRWEKGDDPAKDHQRWAPQCPFLRNPATSGNVPLNPAVSAVTVEHGEIEECSVRMDSPVHPQYASLAARLRTFADWPRSIRQRPEELAEAGFYYTGQSDKTICFSCGGGLRDWESPDVPWEEHARWFDRCPYVRLVKGRNYIQEVSEVSCVLEEKKTSRPKSKFQIPVSSASGLRYFIFLLLSNTLSDIYLELKQTVVSQGASFGNWILISMYSVTLRLMSLWSRSRSLTQEDWRGVSLTLRGLVLSSIANANQIRNRVLHWSFIKRILSILRIFFMAFS